MVGKLELVMGVVLHIIFIFFYLMVFNVSMVLLQVVAIAIYRMQHCLSSIHPFMSQCACLAAQVSHEVLVMHQCIPWPGCSLSHSTVLFVVKQSSLVPVERVSHCGSVDGHHYT